MSEPGRLVLVGAIAGAFGVHGEARVRSFTADPEALMGYAPLLREDGSIALTPSRWRAIKDGFAVTAPEIASREHAETLKGTALYIPHDRLPPTEDDEFYHVDLIGCRVENLAGDPLGEVVAAPNFGAGDLLEIKPASGPAWHLPFTRAAAPVIDIKAKRIVAVPLADAEDAP